MLKLRLAFIACAAVFDSTAALAEVWTQDSLLAPVPLPRRRHPRPAAPVALFRFVSVLRYPNLMTTNA